MKISSDVPLATPVFSTFVARGFLLAAVITIPLDAQSNAAELQIREARAESNQAIRRHDLKAFAISLAEDFQMIRGNGVAIPSREAYIDLFKADFADPHSVRYERITDKVDLSKAAPLAAEHGHWIGTYTDGRRAYGGTYLAMWRLTNSGWKIRSELFVVLSCEDGPACAGYRKP